MNRAMLSGVSGMKAHQTKMDVIGNNIANVNTYGFKSQRAIFSDIYYQSLRSASGGTANRGGINPSGVGYGATLASVQTQMTQSSMQNTGFGLDVAITGEGFLQVMDPDGNIFYTKAGLLDYDSNGYLTDVNGNFVLGAGSKDGAPASQKIRLDNVGSVDAKKPTSVETINGIEYTISASNADKSGNVSLNITSSEKLAAGLKAAATISATGAISVQLNAYEEFGSMAELNDAINKAIKEANGGKEHIAGTFTIATDGATNVFKVPLTGAEIAGTNTGVIPGAITGNNIEDGFFGGGMTFKKFSSGFTGEGDVTAFDAKYTEASNGPPATPASWAVTMTIGGRNYTATIDEKTKASTLLLKSADGDGDYIEVSNPGFAAMNALATGGAPTHDEVIHAIPGPGGIAGANLKATKSVPSKELGFSSTSFTLSGGTSGGAITLDQLSSITIASDGTIMVSHPEKGTVVAGKVSLANFSNPRGLQLEGTNYYSATANSGEPKLCDAGTSGTGSLKSSALEMSNVDLAAEFADMITTQRGFQANSRIITVSDTMLEELINLKR